MIVNPSNEDVKIGPCSIIRLICVISLYNLMILVWIDLFFSTMVIYPSGKSPSYIGMGVVYLYLCHIIGNNLSFQQIFSWHKSNLDNVCFERSRFFMIEVIDWNSATCIISLSWRMCLAMCALHHWVEVQQYCVKRKSEKERKKERYINVFKEAKMAYKTE